jgi:hypothetical protein
MFLEKVGLDLCMSICLSILQRQMQIQFISHGLLEMSAQSNGAISSTFHHERQVSRVMYRADFCHK